MQKVPDHPVIQNLMRTGVPCGSAPHIPRCPVCGGECRRIYLDKSGELFACEDCVQIRRASNMEECLPGEY